MADNFPAGAVIANSCSFQAADGEVSLSRLFGYLEISAGI
jgi:hypothetical protein